MQEEGLEEGWGPRGQGAQGNPCKSSLAGEGMEGFHAWSKQGAHPGFSLTPEQGRRLPMSSAPPTLATLGFLPNPLPQALGQGPAAQTRFYCPT